MITTEPSGTILAAAVTIRNEPVQARSTARLATLLDSAAAVIDEIGYERLTTAMVAERAGASIGTVYRYFPDRIAVLQALAARNLERLISRAAIELSEGRHPSARDAALAIHRVTVDLFRTEPGFRSLRAGDVLDLQPPATDVPGNTVFADSVVDGLVAGYGVVDSAEVRRVVASAIEVGDALIARAFSRSRTGDPVLLAEAERAFGVVLAPQL